MKLTGPLILVAALAACGGNDSAPYMWGGAVSVTGGTPSTVTVTYSAMGVTPATVSVPAGGSIAFVNSDTVAHWPESSPHPTHTQCPWLNMPAAIVAGGSTTVGPATATPTSCAFHDHLNPPAMGGGGGY